MSKGFSLSIRFSSETKERLDRTAQRIGIPREMIVEFAVKELLDDLDSKGADKAEASLRGTGLSDCE